MKEFRITTISMWYAPIPSDNCSITLLCTKATSSRKRLPRASPQRQSTSGIPSGSWSSPSLFFAQVSKSNNLNHESKMAGMSWRLNRERMLSTSISTVITSFKSSGTSTQGTWTKTQIKFKLLRMRSRIKSQMTSTTTWEGYLTKLGGLTDLWTCKWFRPFCISWALITDMRTSAVPSTLILTTTKSSDAAWFTRISKDMMITIE